MTPIYENYISERPVYFHYATASKNCEISLFGLKLSKNYEISLFGLKLSKNYEISLFSLKLSATTVMIWITFFAPCFF